MLHYWDCCVQWMGLCSFWLRKHETKLKTTNTKCIWLNVVDMVGWFACDGMIICLFIFYGIREWNNVKRYDDVNVPTLEWVVFFSILTTLRCCDDPAERFYGYTLLYNCTCVNSIHICNDRQECSNIVPSQTKRAYSMGMCVKHELDELDALNSIPLRNPFFIFIQNAS